MLSVMRSLAPFFILTAVGGLNALSIESDLVQVVDVEPGKSYQQQVILKNEQNEMVKVKIQTLDCQQNGLNFSFFPPGSLDRSNANWVEVIQEIELAPKSKVPLPFKITVPKKALPGSSWSTLAFTIVDPLPKQKTKEAALLRAEAALRELGDVLPHPLVSKDTVSAGSLGVHVVTRHGSLVKGPIVLKQSNLVRGIAFPQWQVSVENEGSGDLFLKSVLELRSSQGAVVFQIPGSSSLLLPGSQADYVFNLSKVPAGTYEAFVIFDDHCGNRFHVQTGLSI